MAAFQHSTQQQYISSFVNIDPSQIAGAAAIPPTNLPPQQPNNGNAFTAGRKRKVPSNQHQNSIPNKQPALQPAQQFFCEICNVQLNSPSQASQHKQGKTHKINATKADLLGAMERSTQEHPSSSELDSNPSPEIIPKGQTRKLGSVNLECVICRKRFNSKTQAEQHFNGQIHKRKLQAVVGSNNVEPTVSGSAGISTPSTEEPDASEPSQEQPGVLPSVDTSTSEIAPSSLDGKNNELYCEFCHLQVNSQSQMDMHLKGAKHKNAVSKAATSTAPEIFYCEDCHINFNSQNQLVQHLTSPKHMNRVNRPQRQQVTGMFRGMARGRGRGQGRGRGRGRGAPRGGQGNRGRGGTMSSTPPPPITSSFVKASNNSTSMGSQGYPFLPPGQSTNFTQNFAIGNQAFQQPFV